MGIGLKRWLRALVDLAEDEVWSLAPIWQLITTITAVLDGTDTLFWPSSTLAHMVHIDSCRYTHIKQK